MQVTGNDRVELVSYQLKDVAHTWFTQWKENSGENAAHVTWECFTRAFLGRFFPRVERGKPLGVHEFETRFYVSPRVQT